jgi:hypothetical protein
VKLSITDSEDPNAVAFGGVAVGVRVKYHDTLPRGLLYLTVAGVPFFVDIVKFRIILLGYIMEEKLPSVFVEIEIALIISREAVIKDYIIALTPAESCDVRRSFKLLV